MSHLHVLKDSHVGFSHPRDRQKFWPDYGTDNPVHAMVNVALPYKYSQSILQRTFIARVLRMQQREGP